MLVIAFGVVFVFSFCLQNTSLFQEIKREINVNLEYNKLLKRAKFYRVFTREENIGENMGRLMFGYQITMLIKSNGFYVNSQVILLEMAKFEVFTKSSGMRTHIPKALVVTVLGPQNDHNTNAAKSLRSFAKQLEISGVKVRETKAQ